MLDVLRYAFIQNALLSGCFIAVAAALAGYFMIARGLTFAGHALPNIGFAGAAGAVLIGVRPVYGMFLFTILASGGIGALGRNLRDRDLSIGVLMSFALGLGLLFLNLYAGYAQRVYSILFGTILGISEQDVVVTAVTMALVLLVILVMYRPLLFTTFDPDVAQARGVPVTFVATTFLVLVAIAVSASIQVMGAILVFTLLAGPAATAARLTRKPAATLVVAAALGVGYVVAGILLAALSGDLPVSFFVATIAFAVYLPVRLFSRRHGGRKDRADTEVSARARRHGGRKARAADAAPED